jgi:hypothetical protein
MQAAEEDFEMNGKKFRAGAFIISNADRGALDTSLRELGLSAWAVPAAPSVKMHDLDIPRIGYVHAWQRTQDEGWVRASLEKFGVPFTYFADIKLREGRLRERFDVIVYPHVGGSAVSHLTGIARTDSGPALPYRKSADTPNLGALDEADDIRGGMGMDGLLELSKFVQAGGMLLVEGSTATIFPEFGITSGVSVETPDDLFARGSVMRGIISDRASPIVYGYDGTQLPVYFNQAPVLNTGGALRGLAAAFGGGSSGPSQNITPMANRLRITPFETDSGAARGRPAGDDNMAQMREMARAFGLNVDDSRPRVVMSFPQNPAEMLLSGTLLNGESLSGRAQVIDAPLGKGHVVMFGIRPFWRWQTHGTYFLGFNAILNWNDLDAGKPAGGRPTSE